MTSATSLILKWLCSVSTPLLKEALEVYCRDFLTSVKGFVSAFIAETEERLIQASNSLKSQTFEVVRFGLLRSFGVALR